MISGLTIERLRLTKTLLERLQGGHTLVIGAPGVGKTYLLNELAQHFIDAGAQMFFIEADRHIIHSKDDLGATLGLHGSFCDALNQLDAKKTAYLIIDSLDAARDELTQRSFRELIEDVHQFNPNWIVVAGVRTYDAIQSRELRLLFPQTAGKRNEYCDSRVIQNHLQIPPLDDGEMEQAAKQSKKLYSLLLHARTELRELLRVPRHIEFMLKLIEDGFPINRLVGLQSEVQLLDCIWEHYITSGKLSELKRTIISVIVSEMYAHRKMSVDRVTIAKNLPSAVLSESLEELFRHDVLSVTTATSALVRFQNHTFFDYAIARHYIEPNEEAKIVEFLVSKQNTIFYRPSISYFWTSQWFRNQGLFWSVTRKLVQSADLPASIRILPYVAISEQAREKADLKVFYEDLTKRLSWSNESIFLLLIALDRFIRQSKLDNGWWILGLRNAAQFLSAREWGYYAGILSWFGDKERIIKLDRSGLEWGELAKSARQLMTHGWETNHPHIIRVNARIIVSIVCKTFQEDARATREILTEILNRLGRTPDAIDELYWLCEGIKNIIDHDPDFAAEIYIRTFGHEEKSEEQTNMGGYVLGLFSNRKQDFYMSQFSLKEIYKYFLQVSPLEAIRALVSVVGAHIAQNEQHYENELVTIEQGGLKYTPDYSYIWDQSRSYQEDARQMLTEYEHWLAAASDGKTIESVLKLLAEQNRFAVIWKRTLEAVTSSPVKLKPLGLRLLNTLPILIGNETHYDSVQALQAIQPLLTEEEEAKIEDSLLSITEYDAPWCFRVEFKEKALRESQVEFLNVLIEDKIKSSKIRTLRNEASEIEKSKKAERPFELGDVTTSPYTREKWLRDQGANPANENNASLVSIANELGAFTSQFNNSYPSIEQIDSTISLFSRALDSYETSRDVADEKVRIDLFTEIAEYAETCLGNGKFDVDSKFGKQVLEILLEAAGHESPKFDPKYHSSFDHPHWSPSPRVEAAQGLVKAFITTKSKDPRIVDALSQLAKDKVPEVRFHLIWNLQNFYHTDQSLFRDIRDYCAKYETSKGILVTFIHCIDGLNAQHLLVSENAGILASVLGRLTKGELQGEVENDAITVFSKMYIFHGDPTAYGYISAKLGGGAENAEAVRLIYQIAFRNLIVNVASQYETLDGRQEVATRALNISDKCLDFLSKALTDLKGASSEPDIVNLRALYHIIDAVGEGFFFDVDFGQEHLRVDAVRLTDAERRKYFNTYVVPILSRLLEICSLEKKSGLPASTAHHLVELSVSWLRLDFENTLQFVHKICVASKFGGYPLDSLSIKAMREVVELCLADYKPKLLDNPDLLQKLSDILDIFIEVGWSDAVDLVLKLDLVFQ